MKILKILRYLRIIYSHGELLILLKIFISELVVLHIVHRYLLSNWWIQTYKIFKITTHYVKLRNECVSDRFDMFPRINRTIIISFTANCMCKKLRNGCVYVINGLLAIATRNSLPIYLQVFQISWKCSFSKFQQNLTTVYCKWCRMFQYQSWDIVANLK